MLALRRLRPREWQAEAHPVRKGRHTAKIQRSGAQQPGESLQIDTACSCFFTTFCVDKRWCQKRPQSDLVGIGSLRRSERQ